MRIRDSNQSPVSSNQSHAAGHWSLPTDRFLTVILLAYLLITLGYGVVNPLFEAPDEHHHFFTALHIAETGTWPPADETTLARQEAAQPPLYYLLVALIIAPLDTSNAAAALWSNPYVQAGISDSPANSNAFVHTPREDWPWHGWVLAAHLARMVSTLLGVGTLVCVYGVAKTLWDKNSGELTGTQRNSRELKGIQKTHPHSPLTAHWSLLPVALVAFLPQFNFIHASISNDSLITFLCAAALWQMVRIWQLIGTEGNSGELATGRAASPASTKRRFFWLGITIGLAILSKTAGLLLLGLAGCLFVVLAVRGKRPRLLLEAFLFVALPALLLSGWLLWRNWTLYGDPTAANRFVALAGGDRNYTLAQVWGEASRVWYSFLGILGWMNVRPPTWLYTLWHGIILLGIGGVINQKLHRFLQIPKENLRSSAVSVDYLLWGIVWVGLVVMGWVQFSLRTSADQGRLLFPALVPLAVGLGAGLKGWKRIEVGWLAAAIALCTTLFCLFVVIPRAYALPSTVTTLPEDVTPLNLDLGEGIQLVAAQIETAEAQPGQDAWVRLYWKAEHVPAAAPIVHIEFVGRGFNQVAQWEGYHGSGRYPANLWPSGVIFMDRLPVRLLPWLEAPTQARLIVTLQEDAPRKPLNIPPVKVIPLTWPESTGATLAEVGSGILLEAVALSATEVQPGDVLEIGVRWRVAAAPGHDYTTFIHLGDPTQPPLAQADGPQIGGDYPTHFWAAGEIIEDTYQLTIPLTLPAGTYPLQMGLYEPDTGFRLPLVAQGTPLPQQAYPVTTITVLP